MIIFNHLQSALSSFTRFFGESTQQSSRRRSQTGLLIAVILLPLLLGVLACMPVPVGDPEKSRVDPAISGIWLSEPGGDLPLMVFDPYDKRTWLVTWIALEEKTSFVSEQSNKERHNEENNGAFTSDLLSKRQYAIEELLLLKGWLTIIEGERFLTFEPKEFNPGATPEHWYVFRMRLDGEDRLQMEAVNADFDGFEDVETPMAAEKTIRLNLKNPDLYGDPEVYHKVTPNDRKVVNQLLEELGVSTEQ